MDLSEDPDDLVPVRDASNGDDARGAPMTEAAFNQQRAVVGKLTREELEDRWGKSS